MSRRLFIGVFDNEEDLLRAVRSSRERGHKIVDVYTPYAVHGLDDAMGLSPSRLPWMVFGIGLLAAALKVWFEYWTTAVDWPLNVGGKPWNSLPAFVPVTFEVMVLFAGLSAVFGMFAVCRLYPGKRAPLPVPRVTDDRFALILEESDSTFDLAAMERLFRTLHAVEVEEQIQ
jgi:ActD protein